MRHAACALFAATLFVSTAAGQVERVSPSAAAPAAVRHTAPAKIDRAELTARATEQRLEREAARAKLHTMMKERMSALVANRHALKERLAESRHDLAGAGRAVHEVERKSDKAASKDVAVKRPGAAHDRATDKAALVVRPHDEKRSERGTVKVERRSDRAGPSSRAASSADARSARASSGAAAARSSPDALPSRAPKSAARSEPVAGRSPRR